MKPSATAPAGVTTPAAGVMTTRPARMPEAMPRAVALRCWTASMQIQASAAAAAAACVTASACAVFSPLDRELPALKPNQPTQSRPTPIITMTRLLGCMAVPG